MSGVTTPNLPSMSVSDSVLVHRGGTTGQQAIDKLAQQLNADLNIADDRLAAEAARDKAQDWAESAGAPGGPGTKSAKTWASDAEQSRMDAEIARDAAFGNADVYLDISAGLASVSDGEQFQVIEGSEIVRYRRDDASTAVEVARYPSAEQVNAIPAKTDPAAHDIEQVVDGLGEIIRRTDAAGEMFLPNLAERSVQAAINEGGQRLSAGASARRRAIMQVEDNSGNVTMMQDERGGLYLPGYPGSVQAALGLPLKHSPRFPSDRDRLHEDIRPLISELREEGLPFIEPPPLLVPNRFDVPDGVQSALSCSAGEGQWLETPYAEGGLVHPYLLEMRRPLLGYRYIMSDSPHLDARAEEENPILYGSNDLETFDLIMDVAQPFDYPPANRAGYNSDPAFTYDPRNGELILFWREYTGGVATIHYRSTWNGVDWTPRHSVATGQAGWLSPAILFAPSDDAWHLWRIQSEGTIEHLTSATPYGPWSLEGSDDLKSRFGIDVWHLEVKWLGNRFALLANQRGDLPDSNLYLGLSVDGTTWDMGPGLIQPAVPHVYKGTFLPEFDGDRLRLHVGWNRYFYPYPPDIVPVFHCEATNWVDLTNL